MNTSEPPSLRELWHAWENRFWTAVETALGPSDSSAPYRMFNDVIVTVDPSDGQECDFIVSGSAVAMPGSSVPHLRFRELWTDHEPQRIAARVLQMVEAVRADPTHRRMHHEGV